MGYQNSLFHTNMTERRLLWLSVTLTVVEGWWTVRLVRGWRKESCWILRPTRDRRGRSLQDRTLQPDLQNQDVPTWHSPNHRMNCTMVIFSGRATSDKLLQSWLFGPVCSSQVATGVITVFKVTIYNWKKLSFRLVKTLYLLTSQPTDPKNVSGQRK